MEMKMYNIGVHIFYPGGIMTPGYEEEMKTKPEITKEIEKDDTPMSAEACAAVLWAGIEAGRFSIAGDLIGNIIRCRAIGMLHLAQANFRLTHSLRCDTDL